VFSDDDTVMGVFGSGYVRHQHSEWLLTTVADLLDDDLAISSAGLLRGGAVAWVEVSIPETSGSATLTGPSATSSISTYAANCPTTSDHRH
jgi:hypothetical protein